MDDLISRDALKDALAKRVPFAVVTSDDAAFAYGLDAAYVTVQSAPTIDPVRHGCWTQDDTFKDLYFCDQCLAGEYRKTKFKYCPDCGARMDADESDGRTSERTLDNCRMIKRHGRPEQDRGAVTCLGFGRAEYDDEPCDTCKQCPLQESNAYEEEEQN